MIQPRRRSRVVATLLLSLRLLLAVLLSPWRIFIAVKRSLTSASVTLMLILLMGLNVIWGYPWTGMLAACMACLVIGWLANRLTRAKLSAGCSLPTSVPVRQSFRVTTHLSCLNRLPALDTQVSWETALMNKEATRTKRSRDVVSADAPKVLAETSEPAFYSLLRGGEPTPYVSIMKFHRRGIQELPPLRVQSTFPFYLFRHVSRINVDTKIAITPVSLDGQSDQHARRIMASVGDWARRLLAGDANEYAGSREYTMGMPVRRWDFTSWARLGRPIVREFRSPSVRSMNLIVDTSMVDSSQVAAAYQSGKASHYDAAFESLMSMTVTLLNLLSTTSVSVELFLANESLDDSTQDPDRAGKTKLADQFTAKMRKFGNERDSQLVRLAVCHPTDVESADNNIQAALSQIGREPTLLLTRRHESDFGYVADDVSIVRFDPEAIDVDADGIGDGAYDNASLNAPGAASRRSSESHSPESESPDAGSERQLNPSAETVA